MRARHDQPLSFAARLLALGALILLWVAALEASANAETYVYEREDSEEGDLYVQEDGEELQRLPIFGGNPSLAPDARRIVYWSQDETSDLMMTDLDGHGPHEILPWAAANQLYAPLSWAPDGSGLIVSDGDILSVHPSTDDWEWETETVVGWSGEQIRPVISPDGAKIAFLSYTKTSGESLGAAAPALFIANRNGSSVEQLTFGEHIGLGLTFSPDSSKIAFTGFDKNDSFAEIYSLKISNGAVTALTNNSVNDSVPDWRSDGRIGFFRSPSSFRVMDGDGKNDELVKNFIGESFIGAADWPQIKGDLPTLGSGTKEEATELLLRYAPKLRYDSKDPFRPMSVVPLFEIYDNEDDPEESNRLIRENDAVVAYSNPDLSEPNLSLDFLRPLGDTYPNGKLVDGDDRLSERTSDAEGAFWDIAATVESSQYGNRAYGRAKYDGGRWWLQYWLWSYYQPFLKGFGDHEGDWEMIQIALNEFGQPDFATYAQHAGGESCKWDELETSIGYYGNLSPDVFVGYGAHASYSDLDAIPGTEYTDAEDPIPVRVEEMKDTADWVEWPGVWGDSEDSPHAPSAQGNKWGQPDDFYEEGDSCG
jgi:hypothetical protein